MSWPKLSGTLKPAVDLSRCQNCNSNVFVSRWREHDDKDISTQTIVLLCKNCSDKLIEPHPRLYSRMDKDEPLPGSMPICIGCKWHEIVRCKNPKSFVNGGAGLTLTFPTPACAFVDGRDPKTGKRFGRRVITYIGPVSACEGREACT